MAIKKPNWLKDAVATPTGYISPKGEVLKRTKLTPEYIAEWNGEAPVVAEKKEEAPKPVSKKKATKKKKTTKKKVAKKVEEEKPEGVLSKMGSLFKK